jgi:hypothetical protein
MYSRCLAAAGLLIFSFVHALSIVDFDTCSIPYIIPLNFQRACDRSDEYISVEAISNGNGGFITSIAPPANVTAAAIRTRPNIWTHEPFCIESPEVNSGFCVYTNDKFANGRGISIVTSPKELTSVLRAPVFREANDSPSFRNAAGNSNKQQQEEIPGKGLGVIANATLNRGDLLQAYTPVLMLQDDFMQFVKDSDLDLLVSMAVERLPQKTQNIFNALHNQFPGNPYVSRIQTNGFTAYAGNAKDHYWAVLPETSRYNHDCRPNSAYYFDSQTLSHQVHVVNKITPGEEITLTYTHPTMTHVDRQAYIHREWGFNCTCSHCSASHALNTISDHRIDLIRELEQKLNDLSPNRTASPQTAELLVSLYEQEHLIGAIGDAYMYTALEYAYIGDKERMQIWATKAMEALALWRGEGHLFYKGMWSLSVEPEDHDAWMYVTNGYQKKDGTKVKNLTPGKNGQVVLPGGQVVA